VLCNGNLRNDTDYQLFKESVSRPWSVFGIGRRKQVVKLIIVLYRVEGILVHGII
jgi:hypothetical protein